MADRFRLLDLNEDCVKTVLQCFDGFDLISFSLCSKKRLANVRSLKIHIYELSLYCGTTFYARFNFGESEVKLFFCEDGYDREIAESDFRPRRLQVDYIKGIVDDYQEPVTRHWRKTSFSGNDWLRHIISVFNCDEMTSFTFMDSKFEIDSLVDIVRNLNISQTTIYQTVSKEHTMELLNALPCVDHLSVGLWTLDEPSEFSILLRNQYSLSVRPQNEMTLDSVLSVNSLSLECFDLPVKDVNRFIKLWKKGANSRLRHLHVIFFANYAVPTALNENEVLRGVPYKRMPQGTVRLFEMSADRVKIDGGFDIVGKSGRKATVTLKSGEIRSSFRMYIWL